MESGRQNLSLLLPGLILTEENSSPEHSLHTLHHNIQLFVVLSIVRKELLDEIWVDQHNGRFIQHTRNHHIIRRMLLLEKVERVIVIFLPIPHLCNHLRQKQFEPLSLHPIPGLGEFLTIPRHLLLGLVDAIVVEPAEPEGQQGQNNVEPHVIVK